jgi:hypothetical protein
MKNSSSGSSFVRMSFALRGAPCGDDSPTWARGGHYHDEQSPNCRPSGDSQPVFRSRMSDVRLLHGKRGRNGVPRFLEGHTVSAEVRFRLPRVPVVSRHRGTVATGSYLGLCR